VAKHLIVQITTLVTVASLSLYFIKTFEWEAKRVMASLTCSLLHCLLDPVMHAQSAQIG
jgi:hypothetical protein